MNIQPQKTYFLKPYYQNKFISMTLEGLKKEKTSWKS